MSDLINTRIIEEVIELADANPNSIIYEQISRLMKAEDLEGMYRLLKELRCQP
jgi:hypothetical protein